MSARDVLVLGGGLDGLAAAATLARGGARVQLLEARPVLGGLAAAEELAPGLSTAGERLAWAPPHGLLDGLDLDVQYAAEDPPLLVADGTARGLFVHASPARMQAELGPEAAQAYAAWRAQLDRWTPPLRAALLARPPDLASQAFADLFGLARSALALRRLGKRDLTELLRVAPTSVQDWLEDTLSDERLRAGLAVSALAGTTAGPRSPGTAATLLLDQVCRGREPAGGPPALAAALASAARARGAELTTGARAARILVEDGAARGALLADGTEVRADQVLSALDVATTLSDLIEPAHLPERLFAAARAWKRRGRVAVVHLALEGPPLLPAAGGEAVARVSTVTSLAAAERAADAAKHGRLPELTWAELRLLPQPAGTVVTLHVHAVPETADGEAARLAVERDARAILLRLAPDARIARARVKLPRDLEREHGLPGGHLCQGELSLDQLFIQRPAPLLARYSTPIAGLWLGGGSSHPGGGLPGGAGILAARALLAT